MRAGYPSRFSHKYYRLVKKTEAGKIIFDRMALSQLYISEANSNFILLKIDINTPLFSATNDSFTTRSPLMDTERIR